jgi:hypothetical protein
MPIEFQHAFAKLHRMKKFVSILASPLFYGRYKLLLATKRSKTKILSRDRLTGSCNFQEGDPFFDI